MKIFDVMRAAMKEAGLIREIFTFVDAGKLESKLSVWGERDRVLAAGHAEFTNETPQEATPDVDARQGSKGPGKNFHGCKRHYAVDMQSGLINRVAATSGGATDAAGPACVFPSGGAECADKGCCGRGAIETLVANGCRDAMIKRDNMKIKNRGKVGGFRECAVRTSACSRKRRTGCAALDWTRRSSRSGRSRSIAT